MTIFAYTDLCLIVKDIPLLRCHEDIEFYKILITERASGQSKSMDGCLIMQVHFMFVL